MDCKIYKWRANVHFYWVRRIPRPLVAQVRLIPAPKGAGIVAARVPKKVLQMAGIDDCYTCSVGQTKTLGNFVKATFYALAKTYGFLSPELWRETRFQKSPIQEYTDFLAQPIVEVPKDPGYPM